MLRRPLALAATALTSVAATSPPAVLAPYIRNGRFDPGDYGWLRGSFADATPAQKAEWRTLSAWRKQCQAEQFASVRADLIKRGVTMSEGNRTNGIGLCGAFGHALLQGDQGDRWVDFQAAVARARPIAQAIIWSAALAQNVADPDKPDAASSLIARPMTDQVLRHALNWDAEIKGAPAVDPAARGVVEAMIWSAIADRDHANTEWLRKTVAVGGWPTIGKVGATAAGSAWLLVQHADDDPVFQYDMLRLMEPLAARGEVAKKNYAYLYDRVTLKLVGKQRYGSQFTCREGRHVPLPLEDEAQVEARRAEAGMDTVAANAARMDKMYGTCPPDVIPLSPAKR